MNPRSEVKLSCYGCSQAILTGETNTIISSMIWNIVHIDKGTIFITVVFFGNWSNRPKFISPVVMLPEARVKSAEMLRHVTPILSCEVHWKQS